MAIKKEILDISDFIHHAAKLYQKYYSGSIYYYHSDDTIGEILENGYINHYFKGERRYGEIIDEFVAKNKMGYYSYDRTILVGKDFVINPRALTIGDYEFGDYSNNNTTAYSQYCHPLTFSKFLENKDIVEHGEFIIDYKILLMSFAFNNNRLVDTDDGITMIYLCENEKIPIDLFFPKVYVDDIKAKKGSNSLNAILEGSEIYAFNKDAIYLSFEKHNETLKLEQEVIGRINEMVRKYGY